MTFKLSGESGTGFDTDNHSQNGANIDSQSGTLKGALESNGALESEGIKKSEESEEAIESDALEMELAALRHHAFNLAQDAASALDSKEDWNVKDYDNIIGIYIKVLTAKTKIGGDEDETERLIGMFTAREENPASSVNSKEDTDES